MTLDDIRLQDYSLDTLPRLRELRDRLLGRQSAICIERARHITDYLKQADPNLHPELRQAGKVRYFLERKKALFPDRSLLAGTTTSKPLGAPLFPEFFALTLWPELETVSARPKNPQQLDPGDAEVLNRDIFPFWMEKNIQEVTRQRFHDPRCLQLFEELVFFIAGKAGCISHCVPSYRVMLEKGLARIIDDCRAKLNERIDEEQKVFCQAAAFALEGIVAYAQHLAEEAERLAALTEDGARKQEFLDMAAVCRHSPARPARTFREAVNGIWICQVAIHAENINMAMSPGRLDQVLYPYYRRDREAGHLQLEEALELVGCLWLKLADNVAMVPEASEELFGGAGTVPAITLGGVDEHGQDAVNDLTYIMLRVTELLKVRDPNVNARYHYEVNSKEYCQRVAEVVVSTKAVPALFNDVANIATLQHQGESLEHARDYGVVGCVELVSCGRDYPASSSIILNLAAPLELALFGGKRPITGDLQVGPNTPSPLSMSSYAEFWQAFKTQLDWLIGQAVALNEYFGQVHQQVMPSPLLSVFYEGPLAAGKDLVNGGALYNSSGATHIGFADVVDSLNAMEQVVFGTGDRKYDAAAMLRAVETDFQGDEGEKMRLYLQNHAPKYGTTSSVARNNARNLIRHLFKTYQGYVNYRGGPYRPAYWTMTNHAGLGGISPAMPSGRRKGRVFASGITPVSGAAPELTTCLNAVAELGGREVPGCWALNIKYTPEDDVAAMSKRFADTVTAYFKAGGQQVQFNVMTYEELLDARDNPEQYPYLMVRVSGYSAYFKDLNDKMKQELITRTQYNLTDGKAMPCPVEF